MGPLAGLTYHDVVIRLRRLGFVFYRSARGRHEIWWNPRTRARTTVPRHPGDLPEGTVRAIVRQAGVDTDTFLGASVLSSALPRTLRTPEFSRVAGWRAVDAATFEITLSTPWAALTDALAMPSGAFVVMPTRVAEAYPTSPIPIEVLADNVGTGPYRLVSVDRERE